MATFADERLSPALVPASSPARFGRLLLLALACSVAPAAQTFDFGQNRVQREAHAWRVLPTEHVDTYYYEPSGAAPGGRVLATFAAEAAEEAYAEVALLFGREPARRIPLIVYPTHAAFAATDVADLPIGAEGIGGLTERYKNRIAVPFMGDWRQFRRVIHHEVVHAVVNDLYFGGSVQALLRSGRRLRLPMWFAEGLPEWSALGWDTHTDLYLRDAVLSGRLPEISRLSGYFAYRGGQNVWEFLAFEYGRESVERLLDDVRTGHDVTSAVRRATGLSVADLSARWREALRTVHGPEAAAREPIDAVGRPLATRTRGGSGVHGSPAISPLGDLVAYVSTRDDRFDVFVVSTVGTAPPRALIERQPLPRFESLRLRSPGLSWAPDGQTLAVATTTRQGDVIALVDIASGRSRDLPLPGLHAIAAVAFSPDGQRLAVEATVGAHSDLFVVDVQTGRTLNLTNDLYGDHAPAWSRDGRSLLFHSDRDADLGLGVATAEAARDGRFDVRRLGRSPFSLYRVAVPDAGAARAASAERLTPYDGWDATFAQSARGPDGAEQVLFVSDRNGAPNLYVLDSAGHQPLTDLQTGILGVSLATDGQRAAVLALADGSPSVWLVRDPLGRADRLPTVLSPTVGAARRGASGTPPALALAPEAVRERNPFLRALAEAPPRRPPTAHDLALADSLLAALATRRDTVERGSLPPAPPEAFASDDPTLPPRAVPQAYRYRVRFTPDLVTASGSYDTVYGIQSLTQMRFSDVLGEHRLSVATNLVLDLRNADYVLRYEHRAGRADYAVEGFHLARELPDGGNATVYRYRNFGGVVRTRRPVDRYRRLDADLGLLGVSLTDLSNVTERTRSRYFVVPRATWTVDHTVAGPVAPARGLRYAASLSGTPGPDATFATLQADVRRYWSLAPGTTVAGRVAAGVSAGPTPQRFYAAGVAGWIGARFASLPVDGPRDFVFATPVLPLRGFGFNEAAGDRYIVANAEVRAPLVAAFLPGPLPLLPLYDVQAVAFADAGVIADGRVRVWRTPDESTGADPTRVLDDVLLGAGVGVRAVALGYPVRLDWAWPFDGHRFGARRVYLSIGLDF